MTLFKFLGKKADPVVLYRKDEDSIGIISEGVLFEETGVFIKWGGNLEELVKDLQLKKERRTDRTIYHWGEQSILKGLKLDLISVCWDSRIVNDLRFLDAFEFLSMGDQYAAKQLKIISAHLEDKIGVPYRKEEKELDVLLEWRVKDVALILNYFEQNSYKLHFQIKKIW